MIWRARLPPRNVVVMLRIRHDIPNVHQHRFVDDLMASVSGSQRLDILRFLATGRRNVTQIADGLFLNVKIVSRNLKHLERCGLVQSARVKNNRIYELTDLVRPLRNGEMVQLVIATCSGHWVLVHADDGDNPDQLVTPPDTFVGVMIAR